MPAEASLLREHEWEQTDSREAPSRGYLRIPDEPEDQGCQEYGPESHRYGRHATKLWTVIALSRPASAQEIEFRTLVQQWKRDTGKLSMLHKIVLHPAYQRIIGMGDKALPWILIELREKGGHWIWALAAITGRDDVALPEHNFKQAVGAWLRWGKENGYL